MATPDRIEKVSKVQIFWLRNRAAASAWTDRFPLLVKIRRWGTAGNQSCCRSQKLFIVQKNDSRKRSNNDESTWHFYSELTEVNNTVLLFGTHLHNVSAFVLYFITAIHPSYINHNSNFYWWGEPLRLTEHRKKVGVEKVFHTLRLVSMHCLLVTFVAFSKHSQHQQSSLKHVDESAENSHLCLTVSNRRTFWVLQFVWSTNL